MLLLALQLSPHDEMVALELARLIAEIEPSMRSNAEIAISARRGTNPVVIDQMAMALRQKFNKVHIIQCKGRATGWPAGCNELWAETMSRCFMLQRDGKTQCTAVVTLEPDIIPLRPDWIDILAAQWDLAKAEGKQVVGHVHDSPGTHINGNAIFEIGLTQRYQRLLSADDLGGWDMYHGKLLLSLGKDTNYIYQLYQIPHISLDQLLSVRKNGVIPAFLHGIKGMSGIDMVRKLIATRAFFTRTDAAHETEVVIPEDRGSKQPKFSVFIRSFERDFVWLKYLMRSIRKNLTGFDEIVIVIPCGQQKECLAQAEILPNEVVLITVQETMKGYLQQMSDKIKADEVCEGNFILFVDSDCVFTQPMNCADFIRDEKPFIIVRDWNEVGDAKCWEDVTRDTLGFQPEAETMARMPLMYHRSTLALFRKFILQSKGCDSATYIGQLSKFSEFNALGGFALKYVRDDYNVVKPFEEPYPQIRQEWSWGGITPEVAAKLESEFPSSSQTKEEEPPAPEPQQFERQVLGAPFNEEPKPKISVVDTPLEGAPHEEIKEESVADTASGDETQSGLGESGTAGTGSNPDASIPPESVPPVAAVEVKKKPARKKK